MLWQLGIAVLVTSYMYNARGHCRGRLLLEMCVRVLRRVAIPRGQLLNLYSLPAPSSYT